MRSVSISTLLTLLSAVASGAHADGPKVHYVTPVEPALPTPEEARRMTDETWSLLAPIGRFHREAARRAWTGAFVDRGAPSTAPSDATLQSPAAPPEG